MSGIHHLLRQLRVWPSRKGQQSIDNSDDNDNNTTDSDNQPTPSEPPPPYTLHDSRPPQSQSRQISKYEVTTNSIQTAIQMAVDAVAESQRSKTADNMAAAIASFATTFSLLYEYHQKSWNFEKAVRDIVDEIGHITNNSSSATPDGKSTVTQSIAEHTGCIQACQMVDKALIDQALFKYTKAISPIPQPEKETIKTVFGQAVLKMARNIHCTASRQTAANAYASCALHTAASITERPLNLYKTSK